MSCRCCICGKDTTGVGKECAFCGPSALGVAQMCYMPIDDPRQLYHNVAVVLDTAVGRRPMNLTLAAVVHGPKAVLPSEPKEITVVPAVLAKYVGVCQLAHVLDYRHSARKPQASGAKLATIAPAAWSISAISTSFERGC